jgi:hypothetical protein
MTATDLVIVGCGGHGREVYGIVQAINRVAGRPRLRVLGFVDDDPSPADKECLDRLGLPLLGAVSWLTNQADPPALVIGIGSPAVRQAVGRRIDTAGAGRLRQVAVTLLHPDATLARAPYCSPAPG